MKTSTVSMFSSSWLMQISLVLSRGMLVKSDSSFKLPIDNEGSCSQIASAKWNHFLTVYLLLVEGSNIGTKILARWLVLVCKADRSDLNAGQLFTSFLCTLQSPYIVSGPIATVFKDLHIYFDILLESNKFLKMVSH